MKIKVCGMRNSENIQGLIALEPDFMGFIFYDKSKRFVADFPKVAIPLSIKKVGVFVNESIENVSKLVTEHQLDYVQLHGEESPDYCSELLKAQSNSSSESFQLGIMRAFSVDENFDFSQTEKFNATCDYFIFDAKGKERGGNGVKFNWDILQNYTGEKPYLLSGGISKNDVNLITEFLQKKENNRCVGLDINSGFEIEPGLKNINDIKEFKQNL